MINLRLRTHSILFLLISLSGLTTLQAQGETSSSDHSCILSLNLLSFDSKLGDLKARLLLMLPKSELTQYFSPKQYYYLVDELTIGESVLTIQPNVPYSSYNNCLSTTYQVDDAGSQFYYPFDAHQTEIRAFVDRQVGEDPSSIARIRVPIRLDTNLCSFEGYSINLIPSKDNSPTFVDLFVKLRRTLSIQFFSIFVSFMMVLVAAGVIIITMKIYRSSSPPEISEMGFCAALLFAFPAIRNIQPFIPPMGVLSDFFGFFWAESLVAIALLILLICYIRRKQHD